MSDWYRLDRQHVWHPFTQMQEWNAGTPLIIERADGNYLFDIEGRRYFDGVSSLWVNVHGHRRPEIDAAIRSQLDLLAHSTLLGLGNVPSIRLAAELVNIAPAGLSRVFYSDSGSTAVEIALKQAFQYWRQRGRPLKQRFVHLSDSYHGDTLGAVGVGGIPLFHHVFGPLLVEGIPVPTPHPHGRPGARLADEVRDQCLRALEQVLAQHADSVGAMIIEPLVQGAAGMFVHPDGYLRGVAALCKAHDVLLIADEVATGFGRTGTMFACEQEGVTPDFLCLAKGLSGGYLPLAVTLTTDEVYGAFLGERSEYKAFFHGHTYTGNPLGCAAALASLAIFAEERVIERLPEKVHALNRALSKLHVPAVRQVRQRGLMVGIELMEARTGESFPNSSFMGSRVCEAMRSRGVITRPLGDVVVLMPPLSSTGDELNMLVDVTASAIEQVCGA